MSNLVQSHAEILKLLKGSISTPGSVNLQIPPRCADELQVSFLEYEKNKRLKATFPVPEKYNNPAGILQGGFLSAYFDNVFGPFSFLVAKNPTTTLDLSVHYVRAINSGETVTIEVFLEGKGLQTMHMTGKAYIKKEKLAATASTTLMILRPPRN